jgi:hypothetical protein
MRSRTPKSGCKPAALLALLLPLALAACNNQWPPPPPQPGQPLTWAQKHYRDLQEQHEMIDRRIH